MFVELVVVGLKRTQENKVFVLGDVDPQEEICFLTGLHFEVYCDYNAAFAQSLKYFFSILK